MTRDPLRERRVVVVGAGIAGLAAALELAARGIAVTLVERAATPGGKMREIAIGDARIDAGPTVLTMRWVFDELFAAAGGSLDAEVGLRPTPVIARHAWGADARLDLYRDVERSAEAIGELAGPAEADGYRRFCVRAKRVYDTLEGPFIRAARPTLPGLVRAVGVQRLADLWATRPFVTLWRALARDFRDERLRQLFGRYATYVGSSPFASPATLMLIAHVEREGVWLVEGGMHRLAAALCLRAAKLGAQLRFGEEVAEVRAEGGRARAVLLKTGERIEADAVVLNADASAVAAGRLGADPARAASAPPRAARSLSAVTWALLARSRGFPLVRHSVFFSQDYAAEFDDVFARRRLPRSPTVYVCAQDRDGADSAPPDGPERLFCLVNAPPTGDTGSFTAAEIEACEERTFAQLSRCGLEVERSREATVVTTPNDFERLFPGTGGALYGPASHGWQASFRRPGTRTSLPGLYLAGGSTHPGAGVPMAALAGRLAAAAALEDFASTGRSRRAATPGGTSMR